MIPEENIRTVGNWSIFNLTWSPAVCNHGNVFYEVSIQIPKDQTLGLMLQTKNPWYEVTRLAPYTMMLVTIRAFTYWGYGPITTATVYSPMSSEN
ncbi:hypothetical protein KUTeg_006580 [Tegillarca granosa]|uniref:Uncharacterized protein n=1 Tax=Tegillarca granosa TaxID=220873 RepID=A0ABQ9FFI4_TEGGR|nr:hypothetical protein KUTeg_006580 [Tegillarca granosa]